MHDKYHAGLQPLYPQQIHTEIRGVSPLFQTILNNDNKSFELPRSRNTAKSIKGFDLTQTIPGMAASSVRRAIYQGSSDLAAMLNMSPMHRFAHHICRSGLFSLHQYRLYVVTAVDALRTCYTEQKGACTSTLPLFHYITLVILTI